MAMPPVHPAIIIVAAMSVLLAHLRSQISSLLSQPDPLALLPCLTLSLPPSLDSLPPAPCPQAQLLLACLTVQDILEPEYYYSYLVSKPLSPQSQVHILKYGLQSIPEQYQEEQYEGVMESAETVICVPHFGGSYWMDQSGCKEGQGMKEGHKGDGGKEGQQGQGEKMITMKVDGSKKQFRLGQRVYIVGVWNPSQRVLHYTRDASEQEIKHNNMDKLQSYRSKQLHYEQTREKLLQNLGTFCSKQQSLLLLYTLVADHPLFINSSHGLHAQLQHLVPFITHVKIKAPFKQSLFPYKNSEGQLIRTPMQLSQQKTFVIVDFSEFSQQNEIKIDSAEIDNLKALKMFVEEGKTIYRWEYGQSLLQHVHCGVIVKGSRIITPHFVIGEDLMPPQDKSESNPFVGMPIGELEEFRAYLLKCQKVEPSLEEQPRGQIEGDVRAEMEKCGNVVKLLGDRMKVARLNAKSMGRETILYQDYEIAKHLLQK